MSRDPDNIAVEFFAPPGLRPAGYQTPARRIPVPSRSPAAFPNSAWRCRSSVASLGPRMRAPTPTSAAAARVMRGNRSVDTRPEVQLRSELHRRGLRFRKHLEIRGAGWKVAPDVVFPRQRLAIFVDGCFWHSCPTHGTSPRSNSDYWSAKLARNRARDARDTTNLNEAGWRVIRVWEHEPVNSAADTIARLWSGTKASWERD
jgi:DNA mismatch endonuclease, patch repair protein